MLQLKNNYNATIETTTMQLHEQLHCNYRTITLQVNNNEVYIEDDFTACAVITRIIQWSFLEDNEDQVIVVRKWPIP